MADPVRPGRTSLAGRLVAWYAVIVVALIGFVAVMVLAGVRTSLEDQLVDDLEEKARIVALDPDLLDQQQVMRVADAADARVTVIAVDGTVLADSSEAPSVMESHADRPEVVAAVAGDVGVDRRVSATLGAERLYVAIPPIEGLVVRLSVSEEQITEDLGSIGRLVVLVSLLVGAVGVGVVWLIARRTARPIRDLTDMAAELAAGRLDVRPARSTVAEVDRLGVAMASLTDELGSRIRETEEERQTLGVVLGALPDGVVLVDADDTIVYANPSFESVVGEPSSRLASLGPHVLQRAIRRAREQGTAAEESFEHGSPPRRLRAVATPFRGDDDRVLLVVSDVTERHRVESMRREFVADASHELKTPVAAILASAETLRIALDRRPEDAGRFAAQVESSARQLARIVEDLLDLSRLEASEMERMRFDLADVVGEEVESAAGRASEAGLRLTVAAEPIEVEGSPRDLALALRNLCDNAIRYTDPGGEIHVSVHRRDGEAVVEVRDSGSGIPKRALPRVFERFYRVDVARSRATGGTGLGLAIVKHVVERHGGSVSVQSELGVGSTFRIRLPASPAS